MKRSLLAIASVVLACLVLVLAAWYSTPALFESVLGGGSAASGSATSAVSGGAGSATASSAPASKTAAAAIAVPSERVVEVVMADPGHSILERYEIPAYDQLDSPVEEDERQGYQMVRKAGELGIASNVLENPAAAQSESMLATISIVGKAFDAAERVVFTGTTGEELQVFLLANAGSQVELANPVKLSHTVELPSNTKLDGAGKQIECSLAGAAFTVRDATGVAVRGITIDGGADYGFAIADSRNVVLQDCSVSNLAEKAVLFAGACEGLLVENCVFSGNQEGAVYFSGNCGYGIVSGCTVENNAGTSNWMAGIALTYHQAEGDPLDMWAPFTSERRHFPTDGAYNPAVGAPHDIAIVDCVVKGNQSSGIYFDGPYRCFVDNCEVSGNDKEGMCLDGQTIACYVHNSDFADNGWRTRQDDTDLQLDEVLDFGRLEDGSAASKLPGISLDNALYNVVEGNRLNNDAGGGVKIVRTGVRNTIAGNQISDCNAGANHVFVFMGIELGNAGGGEGVESIDFKTCLENIVVGNEIFGGYQAGVYLCPDSAGNLVKGNKVEDEQVQATSDASERHNATD